MSYPGEETRGAYRGRVTITSGNALTPSAGALAPAGDPNPQAGVAGSPTTQPSDRGISVTVAPAPTDVPCVGVAAEETHVPAPRPEGATAEVEASLPSRLPAPPSPGTEPESTRPTTSTRLRAALPLNSPGLSGPGGALLGALVVGLGALLDLTLGDELGLGFTATFLLGCVLIALALRVRALAVAVVLPPLLFAAAAFFETKDSGATSGSRQAALDVATTLALSAPVLFSGTALALAVVLGRLVVHAVRR